MVLGWLRDSAGSEMDLALRLGNDEQAKNASQIRHFVTLGSWLKHLAPGRLRGVSPNATKI
jgi:hypothetical protein